jgi:hypothetical protein
MRNYRQDSHTGPLVVWTLLCVGTAVFLFLRISDRVEAVVAGSGLLVVGPAVLSVYLYRARRVWVGVDPERGLVVSGEHVIPWTAILRVERRRPRLREKAGPAEGGPMPDLTSGLGEAPGCMRSGRGEAGAFILAFLLLAVASVVIWLIWMVLLPLLIIPLLEVFAPFGDRIRIVPSKGPILTLRDLRGADAFIANLPRGVQVVES